MIGRLNSHARSLRKRMTPWEIRVWAELRRFNRSGTRFRRQAVIGRYIVDFACFRNKLVIELDGSQHAAERGIRTDKARDKWLNEQGFRVLRFWNSDVQNNLPSIIEAVGNAIEIERPSSPSMGEVPDPGPSRGRRRGCKNTPPGPSGHPPHQGKGGFENFPKTLHDHAVMP
jgi:very-short-patch-repair endonuclease